MKRKPLIELRNVDVALNRKTVLRDITWALRPGEHWMIGGANGSGKSTFLRLLRGEVWPAPNRGERIYRLDDSEQTTAIEVRRHIALVSPELQERYLQQDWRLTGRDVIHTGFAQTDLLYVKLSGEQKRRAEVLAQELCITSLLNRDVQTLSTGELRKVLIARAVVAAPKLLLLDEVCDGLDAKSRRGLLQMIEIIARRGTQLVYTTHRADETLPVIKHVAELEYGRMIERGNNFALRSGVWAKRRHSSFQNMTALCRDAATRRTSERPLIRIENADVFLDLKKVLYGITWQLRRGEHWAVLGANGAGKTTFLKLIASDLYPAVGARMSRFEFTAHNTIWDLRRRIGCVSPLLQTHYRERLNAEQVVVSGFFSSVGLMDKPSIEQLRKARALFREFAVEHLRARSMQAMSFGELRKVLMLRALIHDPELLIFDEPFDGLDAESKLDFSNVLQRISERGTQLLIVTHHLDDVPQCITHGLFLEKGRIVAAGEWPVVRADPRVAELFGE